jgi:hypothetical protein
VTESERERRRRGNHLPRQRDETTEQKEAEKIERSEKVKGRINAKGQVARRRGREGVSVERW